MEPLHKITLSIFGPDGDRTVVQGEFVLTIGRADDCNVILAGDDVDRRHAKLNIQDGQVYLTDMASTSGTFINGVRITHYNDIGKIGPEDRFNIGGYSLCLGDQPTPPPLRRRSLWDRLLGR